MLTRLGAETVAHHADADGDLEQFLFAEHVTLDHYRTYLSRLYGALVPIEAAFEITPGLRDVIDVPARTKSPLVVADLGALGMTHEAIAALPICTAIPAFGNVAVALGWLYVIERPTLASSVIARHLATQLPTEMWHAGSYLSCHAGQTGLMWRALGDAMDRVASFGPAPQPSLGRAISGPMADQIVAAAHKGFRTLRRWRTYHLEPASQLRDAG